MALPHLFPMMFENNDHDLVSLAPNNFAPLVAEDSCNLIFFCELAFPAGLKVVCKDFL